MLSREFGPRTILSTFGLFLLFGLGNTSQGEQLVQQGMKTDFNACQGKLRELISGQRNPQGADDQKIMDITARWLIQRVTLVGTKPKEMTEFHTELERDFINQCLNAKNNKLFVEQLGSHMAKALRKVLAQDFADPENRSAVLNGALMLPPVAKLGQEDVGDLLVELLKDKNKHDVIKLYAAKALREFFPAKIVNVNDNLKDAGTKLKIKRDSDRFNALVDFINRKPPAGTDEGEVAGYAYMRREAVSSLAQAGVPALAALKKGGNGVVDGPVAYELLKVLVKKGEGALKPAPNLQERTEAALGLCNMKDALDDANYNPSMAIYAVGLCFHEIATEYSKDLANLENRREEKKIKAGSKVPLMPFRITTERFKQGIKDLVSQSKGKPAEANAKILDREASRVLDAMAKYQAIQDQLGNLRTKVNSLKPKTRQLYTIKGPEIDPDSFVVNVGSR